MTIPKLVVLTPVGEEVINPSKFNASLNELKKQYGTTFNKSKTSTSAIEAVSVISRSDLAAKIHEVSGEDEEDYSNSHRDRSISMKAQRTKKRNESCSLISDNASMQKPINDFEVV
jgi:hypothetical protein